MHVCPVCGFDGLEDPPYSQHQDPSTGSFEICGCCGFQFGVDDLDRGYSHAEYRNQWINDGARWFGKTAKPQNWNLKKQLSRIGVKM
ncbi:MAG: hypothetical protein C6W59_04240 [Paenibacillaceae bacterium]|jgi:hypothetical protein|nr:MAG: hypothetical protein C6W59_04240 [Paenibacillaceae bacterium]